MPCSVIDDRKRPLTYYRAQDAPHSLGGDLANQFSWSALLVRSSFGKTEGILYRNYDHVSALWQQEQWLPGSTVAEARAHYAAYSVQRTDGLRVVSLNTDLCKCHCLPQLNLSDIENAT